MLTFSLLFEQGTRVHRHWPCAVGRREPRDFWLSAQSDKTAGPLLAPSGVVWQDGARQLDGIWHWHAGWDIELHVDTT